MEYKELVEIETPEEMVEELQKVFPNLPNVLQYPSTILWYIKLYRFYKKRKETYGDFT